MTRLHFKEIAPPRASSLGQVLAAYEVVLLWSLLLLGGLRSALLDPET